MPLETSLEVCEDPTDSLGCVPGLTPGGNPPDTSGDNTTGLPLPGGHPPQTLGTRPARHPASRITTPTPVPAAPPRIQVETVITDSPNDLHIGCGHGLRPHSPMPSGQSPKLVSSPSARSCQWAQEVRFGWSCHMIIFKMDAFNVRFYMGRDANPKNAANPKKNTTIVLMGSGTHEHL